MKYTIIKFYFNIIVVFSKYLLASFLVIFRKNSQLWLVSERGWEARDNGYVFFQYLKENHPDINCKYIIDKTGKDVNKLSNFEQDLVQKDSFEHFIILASATHLISTHILGFCPHSDIFYYITNKIRLFKSKKIVFLQHGIIKDNIPSLYHENTNLSLFISGAKNEYDYIKSKYHYPDNILKYTGLCRYDNLNIFNVKNQILLMPTWRHYLNDSNFKTSIYFNRYRELLDSNKLNELLEKYNLELIFYPHYEVQKFLNLFETHNTSKRIRIAGSDYDVQTLLKESQMLITDFSSVYFDMVYMHKPVLLYQFDEIEFRNGHYREGWLDVRNIGTKVDNLNDLLNCLEKNILNKFALDDNKLEYIESLFQLRDTNNCRRVYQEIAKL